MTSARDLNNITHDSLRARQRFYDEHYNYYISRGFETLEALDNAELDLEAALQRGELE